jgi:cytochrome P450
VAPPALGGSATGANFTRMLRMNDGALHSQLRRCVGAALAALPPAAMRHAVASCASRLLQHEAQPASLAAVESVMHRLPAASVASLLGVPEAELDAAVAAVGDWVAGIAPGAGNDGVARAEIALERLQGLLGPDWPQASSAALARLFNACADGISAELLLANAIGLMMQAHDATAALIGNTLVALAREPQPLSAVPADASLWPSVLAEVARHDAPVHNTRRHVADAMTIGAQNISKGDTVRSCSPPRSAIRRCMRSPRAFGWTGPSGISAASDMGATPARARTWRTASPRSVCANCSTRDSNPSACCRVCGIVRFPISACRGLHRRKTRCPPCPQPIVRRNSTTSRA